MAIKLSLNKTLYSYDGQLEAYVTDTTVVKVQIYTDYDLSDSVLVYQQEDVKDSVAIINNVAEIPGMNLRSGQLSVAVLYDNTLSNFVQIYATKAAALSQNPVDDDPYFTVDRNKRLVSVPGTQDMLAVNFDENSEIITFKFPRYADGVDLSTKEIYVNYERSDKTRNKALCTLTDTSDSYVIFTWVVSAYATQVEGTLNFNIEFRSVDYRWQTQPTSLLVYRSLLYTGEALPDQPELLDQYLDMFSELNSHPPIPGDGGYWKIWSLDTHSYETSEFLLPKGPKGDPGAPGKDGITPTIGSNGNWYLGATDTGKPSQGETGPQGAPGIYYGTTPPTGDTHPVWIDPDGVPDDGGLLPAVTAADNGKFLRVVNGGWACDGGTVKYGKLFRGGYVTSADREVLVGQLGIQHELDLRGSNEGGLTVSPLGDDVRYTCAATYAWYSLTPEDAWRINLRCVFDAVTHNEPVYFHCAAGADRTATLACVLEGLLGMSQSDIDKDYELTTFYSGSDTDANARRRNESEWSGLISALNAKPGSTFRDKCVTFAVELGFTAEEINAYRKAMIDGTPSTVAPNISTFTVTNNIEGATSDNSATEATQYQPYEAVISAQNGKTISSVSVKMGGVDITAEVWQGDETELYRKVKFNLVNCFTDNTQLRVIDGQSFGANISPDAGYTLDGATVSIIMGGTDVSIYYSGGKIAIPRVTGNLVITISAVESGNVASNILTESFKVGGVSNAAVGYENNKRLSTSNGTVKDNTGSCVTGFIPCNKGSVIRIKPLTAPASAGVGATAVVLYNADKSFIVSSYITTSEIGGHFGSCSWEQESSDVFKVTFNSNFPATYKYIRFTIPVADGANAYVTYDAEMPSA